MQVQTALVNQTLETEQKQFIIYPLHSPGDGVGVGVGNTLGVSITVDDGNTVELMTTQTIIYTTKNKLLLSVISSHQLGGVVRNNHTKTRILGSEEMIHSNHNE